MKIDIFDINSKKIKEYELDVNVSDKIDAEDLVARYIKITQINSTQGTSNTKTKSEVRGGGKKPWKQKGTGRARSGSSRSPLWVGGGVSHGPKAYTKNADLNKKMKKTAFKIVFGEKLSNSKVLGLSFDEKKPETSKMSKFLSGLDIEGKVMVIHNNNKDLYLSTRNLKNVDIKNISELGLYDLISSAYVVIEEQSLGLVEERIK